MLTSANAHEVKILRLIVERQDLTALEAFCVYRTHQEVVDCADKAGIDQEELEELLYRL